VRELEKQRVRKRKRERERERLREGLLDAQPNDIQPNDAQQNIKQNTTLNVKADYSDAEWDLC